MPTSRAAPAGTSRTWRTPTCRLASRFLQVRAKDAPARDVLAWTEAIARRAGEAWVIVNDRVDIAIVAGTRHVHLGQDDLPVPEARGAPRPGCRDRTLHAHTGADRRGLRAPDRLPGGGAGVRHRRPKRRDTRRSERRWSSDARRTRRRNGGRVPVVAIGGITLDMAPDRSSRRVRRRWRSSRDLLAARARLARVFLHAFVERR